MNKFLQGVVLFLLATILALGIDNYIKSEDKLTDDPTEDVLPEDDIPGDELPEDDIPNNPDLVEIKLYKDSNTNDVILIYCEFDMSWTEFMNSKYNTIGLYDYSGDGSYLMASIDGMDYDVFIDEIETIDANMSVDAYSEYYITMH